MSLRVNQSQNNSLVYTYFDAGISTQDLNTYCVACLFL